MATFAAQGTLPAPGSSMEAAPLTDTFNHIINTINGNNLDRTNVDYTSTDGIMVMDQDQTVTSTKSWENTAAAAGGVREVAQFGIDPGSGTAADNDGGRLTFYADDDGGNETDIARFDWVLTDASNTTEDGRLDWSVMTAGTLASELQLSGASLNPTTDAGLALGTASLRWGTVYADTLGDTGQALGVAATTFSFDAAATIDTSGNNGLTIDVGSAVLALDALTLESDATTLSFDAAATIDTSGNNNLTLSAGTASLVVTAGDVTVYDDNNNADVSLTMGTGSAESLVVQVLNGGSNKTAEEVRFTSKTASSTADHGKVSFYVDEVEIGTFDDGGLDLASGKVFSINGTEVSSSAVDSIANGADNRIVTFSDSDSLNGEANLTFNGSALQVTGTVTVGVDDNGHDVKFFGAATGKYILWDQAQDTLQFTDNTNLTFGTGNDADIFYDGADLNISPAVVGSGDIVVNGASMEFADSEGVTFGTGKDATIQYDGTNLNVNPDAVGSGRMAVLGTASAGILGTDGTFHVHTASAGSVTANSNFDDLVIENVEEAGLSILTPNDHVGGIYFGDPDNNDQGRMEFDHSTNLLKFGVDNSNHLIINSSGNVGIGETAPLAMLHVKTGDSGASAVSNGNELLLESNDEVGMSFLCATNNGAYINFGDSDDNDIGRINYANDTNAMAFSTNATVAMKIDSAQNIGLGVTPDSWGSDWSAIDVGANGALSGKTTAGAGSYVWLMYNAYHDGSAFKFKQGSDEACALELSDGNFYFKREGDTGSADGTATMDTIWRMMYGGLTFINSTTTDDYAHGGITTGLSINQGTADNNTFDLKSSDVAHGRTSHGETDTYFSIAKYDATRGGALQYVMMDNETQSPCYEVRVTGGQATTSKTQDGCFGLMQFRIAQHNGSNSPVAMTADGVAFAIRCTDNGGDDHAIFAVDEDGDVFAGNGTAMTDMSDDKNDPALLRGFDHAVDELGLAKGMIKNRWDDFVKTRDQDLVELGVLGDTVENGGLYCVTQHTRLMNSAIWQVYSMLLDVIDSLPTETKDKIRKVVPNQLLLEVA